MYENDKGEQRMMKAVLKSKSVHDQGFSLLELLVVISIISTLFAIAGIYGKQYVDRYNAESQIRKMHSDLLQARVQAMEKNMLSTVVVNTGSYKIGFTDDNGVTTWQPLNTLKYTVSSGTGTITMDQKGIISAGTTTESILTLIKFYTGSGTPEYDCMQLYATRINIGRMNGTNCDPR